MEPAGGYNARRRPEAEARTPGISRFAPKTAGGIIKFWLQRFGLLILLVALGVSALNMLTISTHSRVISMTNEQSKGLLQDLAVYQKAADAHLASSVWNRDKLTLNTGALAASLQQQFPELKTVTVTLPLFAHNPVIYVEPAQPVLQLAGRNGAFVIDKEGTAIAAVKDVPTSTLNHLTVVQDQSGLNMALHKQALTSENVNFILTIQSQLAAKQLTISSMTLPAGTSQLDIQLTGKPYFAKFNLQSKNARQQAGTLLATMALLQKQNITPANYIDVRVDGRAYY
jgi:hypothetical protein